MRAINKKIIMSVFSILMVCMMFTVPVLAAGSSYFSKTSTKLNAMNGGISAKSQLSSGSCLGTERSITKVEIYVRATSANDPFDVYVISPNGTRYEFTPSATSSKTYTTNYFNGEDPSGTWTVYIENNNITYKPYQIYPTSTATITIKPTYTWN